MTDPRASHADAAALFLEVLNGITPDQFDLPSPCAGWTVKDLLAHQHGQELGFLAAWAGGGQDLSIWQPVDVGDQALPELEALVRHGVEALNAVADLDAIAVWVPEIRLSDPIPGPLALGAHTLDLAVHAWDISASVGRVLQVPEPLAALVCVGAERIPDTDARHDPGSAFGPALTESRGSSAFDHALRVLGRNPDWRPLAEV